jgi:outer membrane protein assembly factor BamB
MDGAGVSQEDTDTMILSSPAIHGDRLYAASCLLDPPDNFGAIFCLDAATGRQIWSIDSIDGDYIKGFFSSPAVTADGRYLLIGQGLHPDANCRLMRRYPGRASTDRQDRPAHRKLSPPSR